MGQRTVVLHFSDMSGLEVGPDSTVRFSLEGSEYEIDLTPEELAALREALSPFVSNARSRQQGTSRSSEAKRSTAGDTKSGSSPKEIRVWAQEHGYEVPLRGRIPAAVFDAYQAQTSPST